MKTKKTQKKSGIIPVKFVDGELYALTMIPSVAKYGGITPQMAKGEIDPGENAQQAAIREGQEEIGLIPSNIQNVYNLGVEDYGDITIEAYVCTLKDPTKWNTPHFETGAVLWVNLDKNMNRIKPIQKNIFQRVLDNKHKYE
jgi:8-oxo-dGTP pyrophosphatase MutT (NUDIX family)